MKVTFSDIDPLGLPLILVVNDYANTAKIINTKTESVVLDKPADDGVSMAYWDYFIKGVSLEVHLDTHEFSDDAFELRYCYADDTWRLYHSSSNTLIDVFTDEGDCRYELNQYGLDESNTNFTFAFER